MSVYEKMTAIADAIREKTGGTEALSLDDMATAIAGIETGGGYDDGYANGKRAEYDAFWDMYQQNGERIDYAQAFRMVFDDVSFKPKYDMFPDNANQMFSASQITNLKKLLEDAGKVFDVSKARYTTQMFQSSTITHIPTMDFSNASLVSAVFMDTPNLVYVEKCIVAEKHTFPNCFARANKLAEIRFEGVIANDIDFHWSPLSVESMKSIISCLSGTTSGKTLALNVAAVNTRFETSDGAADGSTSEEWQTLIATKPNWTFSLV